MLALKAGEVHIWTAHPDSQDISLAELERLLSPTEIAAADRFVFERHRTSYVFAHGVLRQILSGYMDRTPEEIRFGQNAFGKPFMARAVDAHVQFNMSHSGNAVLVAITHGRHIGADIEQIRQLDFAGIVESNFTPQECAFIQNQPEKTRQNAFFVCWTRKEAFIKAVGKGLSIPLNTFDVFIPQGEAGRRLTAPLEAPGIESWWLADLTVPAGYAGAIAIEDRFVELVYKTWTPL